MKRRDVLGVVSILVLLGLTGSVVAAAEGVRAVGSSGLAYVHRKARERVAERGEARVIVVMGDPTLPKAWARDWRERGGAIRELTRRVRQDAPRFQLRTQYNMFPFLAGTADADALRQLAASPVVEAVYPDRRVKATLAQSGPLIGQPSVEGAGYDGGGIGIAIIDTGIDATHPDLDEGKVVAGYNFMAGDPDFPEYTDPNDYGDDEGHGTYVAGIAAGTGSTYRGIAPGASLISLKALDSWGLGFSSDIIEAIEWCVTYKTDYNIRVINLSLSDGAEWRDPAECDADPEGVAVSEAFDAGIVVCAAVGNEAYFRGVGIPACASDAVAVGATWDAGVEVDTTAYFSNRGELLDVYAPGIWIASASLGGGYEEAGGTSAASPHVAGAAAVLFDLMGGSATADAVVTRLKRTGVQVVDEESGVAAPRIDLVRAKDDEPTSGPDLIVTAVTADGSSGLVGTSVGVTVSVNNQGSTGSSACSAMVGLSDNDVPSPQDAVVVTVDVPALAASETWSSGMVTGTVPAAQAGDYTLTAFVDSVYEVDERNEINNGTTGAGFAVDALSSYVLSNSIPGSMMKGESYEISVQMANLGTTAWEQSDGCQLVSVSPLETNRWGVSSVAMPVASVAPGGSTTFAFNVTAPSEPGLYPCHWQMASGGQTFGEIATGATKVRVFDEAEWGQGYPAIDGTLVAYEDYSGLTGSAISVTDLSSGGRVTMPDDIPFEREPTWPYDPYSPYENFDISFHWFPDISGSWVTWLVDDYPDGIWRLQVTAQEATNLSAMPLRITYQDADAWGPAIDGNFVVWEDYRNDPDGTWECDFLNDNPDIYICDISDVSSAMDHFPPAYPLCTAAGPQFAPRIDYPYVVWEDWRDETETQSDIYVYDLSVDSDGDGTPNWKESVRPSPDPAEMQLTATWWPEEYPDISGTSVVYMDLARDTGLGEVVDIYLRDFESPSAVAIATEPSAFRYHPRIDYPLVVWEDYSNDAENPDIYWYHVEEGFGGAIAASPAIEEWPDVSGDRVVYAKLRTIIDDYWPVFNIWAQEMHREGMVGVCTFVDVLSDFWAWEYIEAAVASGVVQGYPEGDYKPTLAVSRDQMAVYVARAIAGGDAGVPEPTVDPGFSDVSSDYWAYKYIVYAVDEGVVQGYEEGTYLPTAPVDRGQMAVYIARALAGGDSGVPAGPGTPSFPDVGTDFWAYKYVEYIADADVTQGYPDGSYHPEVVVSRDQMAVYVSRAFGYVD